VGLSVLGTLAVHRPPGDVEPVRFLMGIPPGQLSMGGPRISPDGRTLAFVASDSSGDWRLWLRPMGALESRPIPGTEKASPPFWSPDHKSLAFIANGKLQEVPVAGGAVVTLAEVGDGRGDGSWSTSGWILLDGSRGDSLIAIPAAGGAAQPASRLDRVRGDQNHASPRFLPDGRHFIYMAYRNLRGQIKPAIMLGKLGSFDARELGPCNGDVEFVPPHTVLYSIGSSLVAQTLDIGRGALIGDPVPVAEGIPPDTPYLFSAGGSSLAITNASGTSSELVWLDRAGRLLSRVGEPNGYRDIALSPDERSAAVAIADPVTGLDDIWVRDLERGLSTRLTFDRTQETGPVWSADGSRIFYSSDRQGGNYLTYSISASGTGSEDTLDIGNSGNEGPMCASSDGKLLLIGASKGTSWDWDVMVRDIEGKQAPRPFCTSPSVEFGPMLSPDGRWLAYSSDETGRWEIYVRSFPEGLRKWRVSSGGGSSCAWSKNGRELIYQDPTNDLIAVPVASGAEFQPGRPVPLFHADVTTFGWAVHRWAVTSDGQRFLVNQSLKNPLRGITVTRNWMAALPPRR
jgi:Tol biopolymer transport system component